ncbi:unnamed protein product [Arabidopsis halleri]
MLDDYTDLPAPDANVAAFLCDVLVKMKTTAPTSALRGLYVGTALTPLFIGCMLDLSIVKTDLTQEFMDIAYLIHTHCLKVGDQYLVPDPSASVDQLAERLVPVAGHSGATTSQPSPEHSLGPRLGRSRRQPGDQQSSSENPTHHR